jgi:hypothetical protein
MVSQPDKGEHVELDDEPIKLLNTKEEGNRVEVLVD